METYLQGMKFSSFFLLACGAVIKKGEALAGLQEVVQRYGSPAAAGLHALNQFYSHQFTDAFAFGAERLISHQVAIWMMSYADQVIVGGQPSKDSISNLLYSSGISKHTSIVYLNRAGKEDPYTISRFTWEHDSQCPNGFSYPLACPLYHCIYPWHSIPSFVTDKGLAFTVTCKTKLRGGRKCEGKWDLPAHPNSSPVPSPHVGAWRVM
jgi:hypothetical protein